MGHISQSSCRSCWRRSPMLILFSDRAGSKVARWSTGRSLVRVLSRGGNLWTRIMLGIPLRDATGGFRAFRRETLLGLGLDNVASAGYCFQVDLAWRALKAGFRVVEVPITFIEREYGASKMSKRIVIEALGPDHHVGRGTPR